jgi:hypothetical protein
MRKTVSDQYRMHEEIAADYWELELWEQKRC